MYQQIKTLAEDALALQNKDAMDSALRAISAIAAKEGMKTLFEDMRTATPCCGRPEECNVACDVRDTTPAAMWPATKAFFEQTYPTDPGPGCGSDPLVTVTISEGEAPDDIMGSATEDEALEKLAALTAKQMPKRKGGAK